MAEEKRRIAVLGAGVGAVFVGSMAAQVAVLVICGVIAPGLVTKMWFQLTVSSVCLYGCGMVPGWLILRRLDTERAPERRMRALTLAAVVSVAVTALLVGSFAGTAVNYLITLVTGRKQSNPVEAIATGVPLWVLTLCTVILAPVAEELFFRRVLIDRLRRYGDKPAILCAAVIFGLAHGNFSQFFYAYLLGLIFGGMYCATGRLRYSIGLHMAINFFGSVYTTLLTRRVGAEFTPAALIADPAALLMYLGLLAVYGLAILTFVPSLLLIIRRFHPQRRHTGYTARQWAGIVLLNPAVWLDCAVFAARFLL